ncbi:sigma-70 family RNA polymerase sigma factor [Aestuariivivens insulae]|uniref:sigma-70 family RNA polymerase sigma factor n=1 Tax=Aestuariivivens insulae TaxID=1621988 RepID=UPI001F56148A|nr:sigma-70 family RNA polymerase sigma factor [Aestuariivivens insulae]
MNKDIEILWYDLHMELYNFILKRIKNEDDTKDILQDVFFKVQTKIDSLKDTSKLTSWVYQITRNTIIDFFRKKKHVDEDISSIELPENENDDMVYKSLSSCINGKINTLSKTYKEAILLTSFCDFTQLQLAERENISYSGAKSRVQRAKDILKNEILDCPNVEVDSKGKIIDFLK